MTPNGLQELLEILKKPDATKKRNLTAGAHAPGAKSLNEQKKKALEDVSRDIQHTKTMVC